MENTEISQNKQTAPSKTNLLTPDSELHKSSYTIDFVDFLFGIFTFLLGYSYVKLILTKWESALGYLIFTVLFTAVSIGYVLAKQKTIPKKAIFYYLLTFLAVLPLALYQRNSFSWISIVFTILLAVYSVSVACGVRVQDKLGDFLVTDLCNSFLYRTFANFGVQFHAIFRMGSFSVGKEKSSRKKIVTVLLAIVISIIVLFIAIGALSNVDDTFKQITKSIIDAFDFSKIFREMPYLLLALPISLYLFAMFFSGVNNFNISKHSEKTIVLRRSQRKPASQILFVLPMIVLSAVYVLFFVSHAISLSSAIQKGGIVYSEYARQGFFELCQISALNILMCLSAMRFCKKDEKLSKALITLNSIIAFCTLILMGTAATKLGLYMSVYGLTPTRVHAAWALFVIFAVFILLLIRQFKTYNFMKFASAIIVLSYITLSLCGINQIVAKYNFTHYSNGKLQGLLTYDEHSYYVFWNNFDDYEYAAFPYVVELWKKESDTEKKAYMAGAIDWNGNGWHSVTRFTFEEYRAKKLVHPIQAELNLEIKLAEERAEAEEEGTGK